MYAHKGKKPSYVKTKVTKFLVGPITKRENDKQISGLVISICHCNSVLLQKSYQSCIINTCRQWYVNIYNSFHNKI